MRSSRRSGAGRRSAATTGPAPGCAGWPSAGRCGCVIAASPSPPPRRPASSSPEPADLDRLRAVADLPRAQRRRWPCSTWRTSRWPTRPSSWAARQPTVKVHLHRARQRLAQALTPIEAAMADLPIPDDTIDIGLRYRLATLAPPTPLDLARRWTDSRPTCGPAPPGPAAVNIDAVGLAVGTVAAAAALFVAVLVWPGSNGQTRPAVGPPSTPVAPPGPGRLLMASAVGRLESCSPTTGQVRRTFSGTGQPGRIVTSLSTDGAGRYAYVSWRTHGHRLGRHAGIDRVSLPDGAVSTVT